MNSEEIRSIRAAIESFRADSELINAVVAEKRLLPILRNLVSGDGFELIEQVRPEAGVDYVATRPAADGSGRRLGIEYKHYNSARCVDVATVERTLALARGNRLDRLIIVAKPGFTKDALAFATREHPLEIELLDLEALHGWALRIERAVGGGHSRIVAAISELSREAARIVASDPRELDQMEWRDLERMVAAVLQRLGFDAELTPGSKDGGKDVIVRFDEAGVERRYVIEIKHWRAGNHVGQAKIKEFVQVVAREGHDQGLYLATYGYTSDAFAALTEFERSRVKFGAEEKIVSLCRTFVKAERGLWSPAENGLSNVLLDATS